MALAIRWIVLLSILFTQPIFGTDEERKKSGEIYLEALESSDEHLFYREFECPFLALLNDAQQDYYASKTTLAQKKQFIRDYWKTYNPNPMLSENLYLNRFVERWAHVKARFPSKRPPYYDDRGRYYLRYGKPDSRFRELGSVKRVELFNDDNLHNFITRLMAMSAGEYGFAKVDEYYTVLANETWLYRMARAGKRPVELVVHFASSGGDYEEIDDLSKAVRSTARNSRLSWYVSDMLKDRANQLGSTAIFHSLQEIQTFEELLWNAQFAASPEDPVWGWISNPNRRMTKRVEAYQRNEKEGKSDAPHVALNRKKEINHLELYSDIAQFRGPMGSTRLDIQFKTPLDQYKGGMEWPQNQPLTYHCLIRDEALRLVHADSVASEAPAQALASAGLPNALGEMNLFLMPRVSDITLQVRNDQNGEKGFTRFPLQIRDFSGDDLMVSDIQFFYEPETDEIGDLLPFMDVADMMVSPYPYATVRRDQPLMCYFEIYNMQRSGVEEALEITMKVTSSAGEEGMLAKLSRWVTGKEEASISIAHRRDVTRDISEELMGLDLSKLSPGRHRLEVIVKDVNHPQRLVKVEKVLTIE